MNQFLLKSLAAAGVIAGSLLLSGESFAAPMTSFNFSAETDREIVFSSSTNGSFEFADEIGNNDDFRITGQTGGSGNLVGLLGDLEGQYSFSDPQNSNQVTVTTSNGKLTVDDGTGNVSLPTSIFLRCVPTIRSQVTPAEILLARYSSRHPYTAVRMLI